jgi:hypothetical protein
MNENIIIGIFCIVDDLCKSFEAYCKRYMLPSDTGKAWFPAENMSLSEVITIIILFHHSDYRYFKSYYKRAVHGGRLKHFFPETVSYSRFVELKAYSLMPLFIFTHFFMRGKVTGLSFIDSTALIACHNKRIFSHKVFAGIAARGKTSTGWFYGFKLHLAINEHGEILSFYLTPGNVDDRNENVINGLCRDLSGKLFGDRGYISKALFERLWEQGIQLITGLKRNMKNVLMEMEDKMLLRKRAVIESVNNLLKNKCQVEHTRHRSVTNFLVNLLAAISAYNFFPQKPSIHRGSKMPVPIPA